MGQPGENVESWADVEAAQETANSKENTKETPSESAGE